MNTIAGNETETAGLTTLSTWKLYKDCNKCPLSVFVDCLFDQDYSGLIIQGNPPETEIKSAWNVIHTEYSGLVMSDKRYLELELTKEINILVAQCVLVDGIINHLLVCYNKGLVEILNELSLKCDVSENDTLLETQAKLSKVATRAKKWVADYQVKQNELRKLQDENKNPEGREYYSKALLLLSKEQGYAVREKEITVYQFVTAVDMMNKKITQANIAAKLK